MQVMRLGVNLKGERLYKALEQNELIKSLTKGLDQNIEEVLSAKSAADTGLTFRSEAIRKIQDLGDPKVAGWTYLINGSDPNLAEIKEIIKPLAEHRGMEEPDEPLVFNGEGPDEWGEWLTDNYHSLILERDKVPQYVLIVGDPEQVPLKFQSILDTNANVGRVDFDSLDDLKTYIDKLIRIENAEKPFVERKAFFYATDEGMDDPTYFSREFMVKPLEEYVQDELDFNTESLTDFQATKKKLLNALKAKKPALVYTASHGLGAVDQPDEFQRKYNGAICCQHTGDLTLDDLFTAEDIAGLPKDQPFLEGSAFFQFACFGYGTPAQSDYTHWTDDMSEQYAEKDFVAALPKQLLAHPRGPISYIGHLDTAFLHAFADPDDPFADRWNNRIAPFVGILNQLLNVQPSGLAMNEMNKRYNVSNALLTNIYDRQKKGKMKWNERSEARFVDSWIVRSDAQNYMIFGDPAARLRIPA